MEGNFNFASEIHRMPEIPPRQRSGTHHRRSRSDTFSFDDSIDDLLLFDASDIDFSSLDLFTTNNPPPRVSPMAVDSPSDSSSSNGPPPPDIPKPVQHPRRHVRSLSVDSDLLDDFSASASAVDEKPLPPAAAASGHQRSSSMDGATTSFNVDSILASVGSKDGMRKAMGMATDKLAELALLDPKRAKRILANRQSAARSKERKIRYTSELERKVQTLQNEATTLSAQVTMLQRGTSDLTTENKQLKLRLQAMEQQAQLRDALNSALREELQRLKIAAGEIPPANRNPFSRAQPPQFPSQQPALHQFGSSQGQPHQQQASPEMPNSSASNQPLNGQPHPNFVDFNKRV